MVMVGTMISLLPIKTLKINRLLLASYTHWYVTVFWLCWQHRIGWSYGYSVVDPFNSSASQSNMDPTNNLHSTSEFAAV